MYLIIVPLYIICFVKFGNSQIRVDELASVGTVDIVLGFYPDI